MNDVVQPQLSILRRKQVQARTGLSRSTIYLYVKDGVFPKPIALGPRAVGWIESEVSEWIAARMKLARGNANSSAR
jgi:prophage regulatory protein